MAQGEIESLDEGGIERAGEAEGLEAFSEMRQVAQAHEAFDELELATAIRLFDLPIDQVMGDLPTGRTGGGVCRPLTEVGGQSVEVEIEAVAGKDRQAAGGQDERERMDDGMRHNLSAWANLEGGDEFGHRVAGGPPPQVVRLVAQGSKQLIELEMAKGELVEEVGVNLFGVHSGAREPQANSDLGVVEQPGRIGEGQTPVDGQEDLSGWGAETIQGRAPPTGKAFAAGQTTQPLNAIRATFVLPHQGMKSRVGVAEVVAVRAWAGVTRGADSFALAARTLAFTPRQHAWFAHVAPDGHGMRASTHGTIVGSA